MRHILIGAATASLCVASAALADTATRIGTAAVTTNAVNGALGATRRDLRRGDGVFRDERISTGANSGAQLLFQDETALTMGSNSQVVLDKLIYDPDKRTGEMSIRAVTGAFRFVSGSGPKQGYSIATPMGTIGVRGTIIQFWVTPSQITLQLDEGGALFCAGAKCVGLDKPGTYLVATAQQVGAAQSKSGKECGGGSIPCQITGQGDTLYLQFLDRRTFNDVTPSAPIFSPPPPANNPPPNNPPPANPPPTGVPQTKFGVPFPPEIANRAFGVPLPPATNPPAPPPPGIPQTKYGVPLPAAIANRAYNLPQK